MIDLLYRCDDFVIVDKPEGVSFHSEDGSPGLFEQVKQQLELDALYPVHRLDKITSGLVIFALTAEVAGQFGGLFERHAIDKYYLAVVKGKPQKKQGWVKGDMVKARRGAYKLLRSTNNPAVTRFISAVPSSGSRLFLVKPYSGKTHQIRVALKSLGTPILGDSLYGAEGADRAYLHAYGLNFELGGKAYQFTCPPTSGQYFIDEKLKTWLTEQWSAPWSQF